MRGRPKKYFSEEERKQARIARYNENPKKHIDRYKKWYADNKDWMYNYNKKYREDNKEIIIEQSKLWRQKNTEKIKEYNLKYRNKHNGNIKRDKEKAKLSLRLWRINNRERYLEYFRNYQKKHFEEKDLIYFYSNIRSLICSSFKRSRKIYRKKLKSEQILGCTLDELKMYILGKCPEGVTLKDFGRYGYHIDHIIPLSTAKNEDDIIKLNHYTNLQPLWYKENLSKSNKILENVELQ